MTLLLINVMPYMIYYISATLFCLIENTPIIQRQLDRGTFTGTFQWVVSSLAYFRMDDNSAQFFRIKLTSDLKDCVEGNESFACPSYFACIPPADCVFGNNCN